MKMVFWSNGMLLMQMLIYKYPNTNQNANKGQVVDFGGKLSCGHFLLSRRRLF